MATTKFDLTEETLRDELILIGMTNMDSFKIAVYMLLQTSNRYYKQMSNSEASVMILSRTLNRVKKWSDEQLLDAINEPKGKMGKKLAGLYTFSRKDVSSKMQQDKQHQDVLIDSLAFYAGQEVKDEITKLDEPQDVETDVVMNIVDKVFNTQRAVFVKSVLQFGRQETQERLELTSQQFTDRLRLAEKYLEKNKDKLNEVLAQYDMNPKTASATLVTVYELLFETDAPDNVIEEEVAKEIKSHQGYWGNFIGNIANVKNPVIMLRDFTDAYRIDQYKFSNAVAKAYDDSNK